MEVKKKKKTNALFNLYVAAHDIYPFIQESRKESQMICDHFHIWKYLKKTNVEGESRRW